MSPTIANPVMGFRAQSFPTFTQRPEKDHRVSVEPLSKHFSRPPDTKFQAILAEHPVDVDHPVDKVGNRKKSTKTRRLRLWLRKLSSKRLSKSLPRKCVDIPCAVDSEHLVSTSQSVPDDRPPDYSDDGSTDPTLRFLKQLAGDDASWKVRFAAVECVDLVVHTSQSGETGPDDCRRISATGPPQIHPTVLTRLGTDPRPIICHIQPAQPSTELSALQDYFQNFYHTLKPFVSGPRSSPGAQALNLVTADTWDNLFPDDDADDAGYMPVRGSAGVMSGGAGIAVSRRHDHDQHSPPPPPPPPSPPIQTTTEGCNSAGPSRLSQTAPLVGLQTRDSFSTPFLARVGTWEIDGLHKSTSLQPTPDSEPREDVVLVVSNFDHDFQGGDAATPPAVEWRHPKFDDFKSTGIKEYSDKSTESGQSSSYGTAWSSQNSGSVNQNLPLKRGRHEEDPNERKKRKRKDERPRNPPGKEEAFSCPFKSAGPNGSDRVVRACSTNFPNQSKLKEHIRRAHFKQLQCPHNGCTFCAGSPFEIKRHQRANHPSPQPPLDPIETTNLDDFHRNKALGLKNLTGEMISRICSSIDYVHEKLRESSEVDGGSNPECGEYEIEDEGGEVPDPASNSKINETDESTPADFGNGNAPEKRDGSVGPLFEDEEHPNFTDKYNTSSPSNGSRNDAPRSDNGRETQGTGSFIDDKFQEMKQKLTPEIFAYFGSHCLDETSSNKVVQVQAFFERFYQAGHGILTGYDNPSPISDPQTNYASSAWQLDQALYLTWNPYDDYNPPPSSSQTYCVPSQTYLPSYHTDSVPSQTWEQSANLSTDAPMDSGQGNLATAQDPSQSPSMSKELLLDLVPPAGEWPYW